jgi:sec-independent protein translocase protein TatC
MDTRQLTFGEHLEELRAHVVRSVAYFAVALLVCLLFQDPLLSVVLWPQQRIAADGRDDRFARAAAELEQALALVRAPGFESAPPERRVEAGRLLDRALKTIQSGPDARLNFLSPQAAFLAYLKVAFICAIFVSSPLVIWELWRFVAAGLHDSEKRHVRLFAPLSLVCFAGGALFGYFLLIPISLSYLESYGSPELMTATITLEAYLDLFLGLTLAIGLMFEVPLVAAFLSVVGIVSLEQLVRFRRHWLFAACLIAAIITPTGDPITLAICTAPLLVLYEIGIIAVRVLERPRP